MNHNKNDGIGTSTSNGISLSTTGILEKLKLTHNSSAKKKRANQWSKRRVSGRSRSGAYACLPRSGTSRPALFDVYPRASWNNSTNEIPSPQRFGASVCCTDSDVKEAVSGTEDVARNNGSKKSVVTTYVLSVGGANMQSYTNSGASVCSENKNRVLGNISSDGGGMAHIHPTQ
ncbi:hypothetical protein [Candidatus Anaplasma sp. TIGMIC]|uniref:hypothetical protein n=1 Tax=Candidatus Anaplasma sp. TIGMIC TaxID=3020713 RepID=UPI00232D7BB8|nr:hypothetical protein [Candidatus Anaplasma sp. TIGMIC]MDB1135409.1 hypothetical protein [Candidatus Anaplasma sp. TIGMIC]